jgi:hypothetical protein
MEAVVVTSKEIGLEVNADKSKFVVNSQDQHMGQNCNINIGNKSFERVEQFRYLETTLTNWNFIHEEIMSRLKSGNACYDLVQNLLFSSLLSRKIKIKVYRTNFACCVIWVWSMVSHTEGGT